MQTRVSPALTALSICFACAVLLSAGWVLWEALHLRWSPSVFGWLLLFLALLQMTQAVRVLQAEEIEARDGAAAMAISAIVLAISLYLLAV